MLLQKSGGILADSSSVSGLSAASLQVRLHVHGGVWEKVLAEDKMRVLVNRRLATSDTKLAVSEGAGRVSRSAD